MRPQIIKRCACLLLVTALSDFSSNGVAQQDAPNQPADSQGPSDAPSNVLGPSANMHTAESVGDPPLPVASDDESRDSADAPLYETNQNEESNEGRPTKSNDKRRKPRGQAEDQVVALGQGGRYYCSGTIVGARFVLTARHCIPVTTLVAGADVFAPTYQARIVRTWLHPDPRIDLALVQVDQALPSSGLSLQGIRDTSTATGRTRVLGYGANDSSGIRGQGKRRSQVLMAPVLECDAARADAYGCQPQQEMVIISADGRDTCDGDSGGPVLIEAGRRWKLIGITSRPVRFARRRCGDGGIYVSVGPVASWARKTMDQAHVSTRGR